MTGLFLNAHATFGWYNIATFTGNYRYQDHKHISPTFGGGIGAGYKLPLSRDPEGRWGLEFTLGAGVLPLHYDIFYNEHNGLLAGEERKTSFGLDNAAITVTYRIGRKAKQKTAR